jgi:hypothetical protein
MAGSSTRRLPFVDVRDMAEPFEFERNPMGPFPVAARVADEAVRQGPPLRPVSTSPRVTHRRLRTGLGPFAAKWIAGPPSSPPVSRSGP